MRKQLIEAIMSGNTSQLQALTQPGKQVVILDTFLDILKWTSSGEMEIPTLTFIETERFKEMWQKINFSII